MISKIIAGAMVVCGGLWSEAYVSANFLLFGTNVDGVTEERLQTLNEVRTKEGKQAVTTIYLPIFEEDRGQYEVMQGKGPYIYAGELQLAKNSGIPLFFQLSEPGRGDIVHSWIPFDQFFGYMQALDLINEEHPIDLEIFDAVKPYNTLLQLTREPFDDPMQVMVAGVNFTHERFAQVPEAAKNIPEGALKAAIALIDKERTRTYSQK